MTSYVSDEKIVQLGCGVVGFALLRSYVHRGYETIGMDISSEAIKKVQEHGIPVYHPFKDDLSEVTDVSVVLVSIQTPLDHTTKRLKMEWVLSSVPTVAKLVNQSSRRVIVQVRSTVPVGFTKRYVELVNEQTTKEFDYCFQPEFLRAVSAFDDAINPWRVLVGVENPEKKELVDRLLKIHLPFVNNDSERFLVMLLEEAEIHKVVHNFSNALRISFSNAMHGLVSTINRKGGFQMDSQHVMDNVSKTAESFLNPEYGIQVGKAYSGVCLPKDSKELFGMAWEYGADTSVQALIKSVSDVNQYIGNSVELQREMKESPRIMSASDLKVMTKSGSAESVPNF